MNKKTLSIAFSGDIGFDKYMDKKWLDDSLLSNDILQFFHSADHVCINVEGAIIDADSIQNKTQFFHAMNPSAITVFNKMNADVWAIANNHIMDAGENGVKSTLQYAIEFGAKTIGAGLNLDQASTPIYLDGAGGIGIINVCYLKAETPATDNTAGFFRWDDMAKIESRIKQIKEKCRWCVIVAHGGDEFSPIPNTYTRNRYIEYLKLGADIVVGHHPHVVENYELFNNGKAIFYSLGNFIFDTDYQRAHINTDVGVLLKLEFTETDYAFSAIGVKIDRTTQRLHKTDLPDIFTDVSDIEYQILCPLSATAFLQEEKKKLLYLDKERFSSFETTDWETYYFTDEHDGYVKGSLMDLSIVYENAKSFADGSWKQSKLQKVKEYLLKHIN